MNRRPYGKPQEAGHSATTKTEERDETRARGGIATIGAHATERDAGTYAESSPDDPQHESAMASVASPGPERVHSGRWKDPLSPADEERDAVL